MKPERLLRIQRSALADAAPRKPVLSALVRQEWIAAEALSALRGAPAVAFTLVLDLDLERTGNALEAGIGGQGRYGAGWRFFASATWPPMGLVGERGVSAVVLRATRRDQITAAGADLVAAELLAQVKAKIGRDEHLTRGTR